LIRSRITTPAVVVLVSLVVSLGAGPASASAATTVDRPGAGQFQESVLVTGTGEVSATPDTLVADFAVQADGTTVGKALDRANSAAVKMRDTLVRAGVVAADLQTSNFSIGSKVDDKQAIIGYTASEGLTAKIRDLPKAGEVMSAAIAAGGDAVRLNGVSFAIEKDAALLAEARRKAFADARQKAELYAGEAGRPLGRVLQVSEESPGNGVPVYRFSPGAMDSRIPIEPGQQQLSVTVTVEWALGPLPARAH
jgi:uncharacterized protein YggE